MLPVPEANIAVSGSRSTTLRVARKTKITLNQPLIRALNRICSSATRNGLNFVAESISG
jgi:hypothetical protein